MTSAGRKAVRRRCTWAPGGAVVCLLGTSLALAQGQVRVCAAGDSFCAAAQDLPQYRDGVRQKPEDAIAHFNLANFLYGKHDISGAITEFHKALRIRADYPEAHNNLGVALGERYATPNAAAEFREALRLNPAYGEAHNNLGNMLRDQHDVDGAIVEYRQAVDLKPDDAYMCSNLQGALYEKRGRGETPGSGPQ